MITLPLIRQDDDSNLTPIDRAVCGLDSLITALMMQGTINDPKASAEEVETFMTLSVAATIPAEA
tara:strand:+ start:897 stop:1091 length:195 start_codon:yes stop_codon:yes gene_type:complete